MKSLFMLILPMRQAIFLYLSSDFYFMRRRNSLQMMAVAVDTLSDSEVLRSVG